MEKTTVLLLVAAFIVALLIAVFQYFLKNKEEGYLKYWLSFFRFTSIFLILVLFINPSIKKTTISNEKPNLLVAVDNSSSIKYLKNDSTVVKIIQILKENKKLNKQFKAIFYSFGNDLKRTDSFNFKDNQTNLSLPLISLSEIYKNTIHPTILITDGNQTSGNTIEYLNLKSPIYPIIVGDTTDFEDLKISNINLNSSTNINNKFPVEVFINYDGIKDITKKLTIFKNNKPLFSKKIHLSEKQNSENELIYLKANKSGIQYFKAVIEPLGNEKNKVNNTKYFNINVIDKPTKILIISSINHPDLGMIKRSIESNKQFKVTLKNKFNYKLLKNDYKLVILYQPNNKFNNIFKEINDKKLNYFIISGTQTNWNFLNKNQPYFTKKEIKSKEEYLPVMNVDYNNFVINNLDISDFPPLQTNFGDIKFNYSYKTLLFKKVGNIITNKPLLATLENNNQKVALLVGENSWKWRMKSFDSESGFKKFDTFFVNLIQFLVSNKTNNQLKVVSKKIYFTNESVKIIANYFDKNSNLDTRVKLWLTLRNNRTNTVKKIPFTLLNNQFLAELTGLIPGDYIYSVSAEKQHISYSNSFKILDFNIENQFSNSNNKVLKKLALKSTGNIFYTHQENKLLSTLFTNPRFKNIQKTTKVNMPLIEWKWLLILLLSSITIEWFIRKYHGKI